MSETTTPPTGQLIAVSTFITQDYNGEESTVMIFCGSLAELNHYLGTHKHTGAPEARQALVQLGDIITKDEPINVPGILLARQFAEKLGTRQKGKELTEAEQAEAKQKGLVVVFGHADLFVSSDYFTEFRGSIHDQKVYEFPSDNSVNNLRFSKKGKFFDEDAFAALESLVESETIPEMPAVNKITASYDVMEGEGCWQYRSTIPYATFDVWDEQEIFCKAIVFAIKDLA